MKSRTTKKRIESLHANQGAAMVMVLIVSAVVMVFCLSLLLVTYSLFAQSAKQISRMQCKMLAQSMTEMLEQDFSKKDSDLNRYLKKQIEDGTWIAGGEQEEENKEDSSSFVSGVENLLLDLDTQDSIGDYHVTVDLSYRLNVASDDDGSEDEEEEKDDQDTQGSLDAQDTQDTQNTQGTQKTDSSVALENGQSAKQAGSKETKADNETQTGNGTYAIRAVICCMRGDGSSLDAQSYSIEMEYPAVSFE